MKIPRVFPIAITVILAGCLPEEESTGAAKAATKQSASKQQPSATSTETTPLAEWQQTLLDVAYRAVSGMPLNPHIKNRSRGQETVVVASLLLEQPDLARRYIGDIANWRRGAGYAALARFFDAAAASSSPPPSACAARFRFLSSIASMAFAWSTLRR